MSRYLVHLIKTYGSIFSFLVVALGSLPVLVDYNGESINQVIDFISDDFGDTSEAMEDINTEFKLKELNVGHQDRMILNSSYIRNSLKFEQIETNHSLEVFYEVVTPPPEA